jgi:hypothetical protein
MLKIKFLLSLLFLILLLCAVSEPTLAGTGVTTSRLYGSDSIGTSIHIADCWGKTGSAVIVSDSSTDTMNALVAVPLAGKSSPILVTDPNTLSSAVEDELTKLGVVQVYAVGNLSKSVIAQLLQLPGMSVSVINGGSNQNTAALVASKLTNPAGSFVIGYSDIGDAISIASYAAANNYSILVANPDGSLPASEIPYKGSMVWLIGGPTLVTDISGANRMFGVDRFATNQAALHAFGYRYVNIYITNGDDVNLLDSVITAPLAATSSAPIVLTDTSGYGSDALLDVHKDLTAATTVTAIGAPTLVPDSTVLSLVNGTSLPTLQSIAITTPATKLSYNIGDSLDITGLVVTGTYSDGSTTPEAITVANVSGFNGSVAATNQVLTITVNGMTATYDVQIVAAPNTSGIGDFYDTTTMIHYSMSGITEATKSNLAAAFANGDHFVKKQAGGKFLDYNAAYAEFARLMSTGSSATDAILAIAADTTLQTTINTSTFTEASSTVVNPFLVAPKFNIFDIDGTLDLTKATIVKATGVEGSVSGVVNTTTGAFTINTALFATESVTIQAYDAQGNTVGNPVSVVVM